MFVTAIRHAYTIHRTEIYTKKKLQKAKEEEKERKLFSYSGENLILQKLTEQIETVKEAYSDPENKTKNFFDLFPNEPMAGEEIVEENQEYQHVLYSASQVNQQQLKFGFDEDGYSAHLGRPRSVSTPPMTRKASVRPPSIHQSERKASPLDPFPSEKELSTRVLKSDGMSMRSGVSRGRRYRRRGPVLLTEN